MIIRVDTLSHIITDTSNVLGISEDSLLMDIQHIDWNMGDIKGYEYIKQHHPKELTQIYICHLARKLSTDTNTVLLPLQRVLLTQNAFSDFLKTYKVEFFLQGNGSISIVHNGTPIAWENCDNPLFNVARFRNRLSFDYAINGFQFLYDIEHSAQNRNIYWKAPEFLQDLSFLLSKDLATIFQEHSSNYVALCLVSKDNIQFDCTISHTFDEVYIYSALRYIAGYCCKKKYSGDNPRLRVSDNLNVQVNKWIPEEEIPCQP